MAKEPSSMDRVSNGHGKADDQQKHSDSPISLGVQLPRRSEDDGGPGAPVVPKGSWQLGQ
ncbi:hypothetical protein PG984_005751 [Apiospora sp. TS-2023a]